MSSKFQMLWFYIYWYTIYILPTPLVTKLRGSYNFRPGPYKSFVVHLHIEVHLNLHIKSVNWAKS